MADHIEMSRRGTGMRPVTLPAVAGCTRVRPGATSERLEPRRLFAATLTEFPIPSPQSFPGLIITGPDGNLWFGEQRGAIGRITPAGTIAEFPLPTTNAGLADIKPGPDGNVWFTEFSANNVGRITPDGSVTEFPVPTSNAGPSGIVSAPDGNLYFTEASANQIGRITPSGQISEVALPTPNAQPGPIRVGSDGNLWFLEAGANKVGRISTTGQVAEFAIPTLGTVAGFVLGPDGSMWLSESDGNNIARVTTSGVITEFPIPTAASAAGAIRAGADGNLWFVETDGNKIGRITPSGVITEFAIPTSGSQPVALTSGPDGNMWFLETIGNKVGEITPAGTITEIPVPTASSFPFNITVGPDNNLWLTEQTGNNIAQVKPGDSAPSGDVTPPTASVDASQPSPVAGAGTYAFKVTYQDNVAVNFATAGSGDVEVTGPNGFDQAATLVSAPSQPSARGSVTYQITAPNGSLTPAASGVYTVIEKGTVKDTSGNAIAAGSIGSFTLNVPSAGGADLVGTLSGALPASVIGGAKGRVTLRITNQGAAIAQGTIDVALLASESQSLDGSATPITDVPVALKLRHGASKSVTIKFSYPNVSDGSYFLLANVNDMGTIAESDLTNNLAASANPVTIAQPFVKLKASVTGPEPVVAVAGAKGRAVVKITNSGNTASAGAAAVQVFLSSDATLDDSDTLLGTLSIPSLRLRPGSSHTQTLKFIFPAATSGSLFLIAAVSQS